MMWWVRLMMLRADLWLIRQRMQWKAAWREVVRFKR